MSEPNDPEAIYPTFPPYVFRLSTEDFYLHLAKFEKHISQRAEVIAKTGTGDIQIGGRFGHVNKSKLMYLSGRKGP
jgi:hypothetical protein